MVTLHNYLLVSAFLFTMGVACILVRRNVIQILMGVELLLNAAAINFVAFSVFTPAKHPALSLSGQAVAIFVIVLAAAEAAVALALILAVFRLFKTVNIDSVKDLKG